MNTNLVILLTATVRPNGMSYTKLQDIKERKNQYLKALYFYLNNTNLRIVFCENSGYNIFNEIDKNTSDRVEYITFNGNNYEPSFGKGFGESRIIKYAIENSTFIKEADYIIKITGRIIINNINEILQQINKYRQNLLFLNFCSEWACINTVCMIIPPNWIYEILKENGDSIRDKTYNFETAIYNAVITSENKIKLIYPYINGICGGNAKPYVNMPIIRQKGTCFFILYMIYRNRKLFVKSYIAKLQYLYFRIYEKLNFN